AVREWLQQQWHSQQFTPESLLAYFQQTCEQTIGKNVEAFVTSLIDPLMPKSRWARTTYDPATIWQTLGQIGQVMGAHNEMGGNRQPGQLEDALLAASETIGKEWESKIMHLAICLIEQPDFRLSGAEEAVASLQLMIAHVLEPLEPQSHVQLERSNEAYERLRQLLAEDSRRKEAAQLAELLRAYAMYRYQWLMLRHASRVFTRLRDRIADAKKDVDYCRQRLTH